MSEIYCPSCHKQTPEHASCAHCGKGALLKGRWILEAMVGHGASGYTWRARDIKTSRVVAIKELSFRRMTDLKQLELFEREARALESLNHPGVPRFDEEFVIEDERFVSAYLVQEFIDGGVVSLQSRTTEGAIRDFLSEMADVLEVLHSSRPPVIHRDIKPSNVMRRKDGRYVLIDFGSIRAVSQATLGGSTVAGTLGYMAPEQLLGRAEAASDYYGVGATALAMLAGREAHHVLDSHDPGAWRRSVKMSPRLADLLEQLLQPRAEKRLADPDELRRALRELDRAPEVPRPPEASAPTRLRDRVFGLIKSKKKPPLVNFPDDKPARVRAPAPGNGPAAGNKWTRPVGVGVASLVVVLTILHILDPLYLRSVGLYLGAASILSMLVTLVATFFLVGISLLVIMLLTERLKLPDALERDVYVVVTTALFLILLGVTGSGLRPPSEGVWVVERGDEVRVITVGKRGALCKVAAWDVATRELRGLGGMQASESGCSPEFTEHGSVWLQTESLGRRRYVLFDLWTGEQLFNPAKDVQGDFKMLKRVGEFIRIQRPDGSEELVGPPRARQDLDHGSYLTSKKVTNRGDRTIWGLFRATLLIDHPDCGRLVTHRATAFGDGELLLSAVRPDAEDTLWTKPMQGVLGSGELRAVLHGPGQCLLVRSRPMVVGGAVLILLDPATGLIEPYFVL